jgi:gliding motility-associated-like protein
MVTDAHGCQDSIEMIMITVEEDSPGVFIPEGFSPNGDGYNDRFEILGIEAYPENELVIFNKQGVVIYHHRNYQNDWDGTPEEGGVIGGTLPEGTYYYIFTYGESRVKKGYIYLNKE